MKTILAAVLAAAALVSAAGATQAAPDRVKIGLLTCNIDAGFGYLIGSDKGLDCWFKPSNGGKTEHYTGSVKKLGLDVGYTAGGKLAWAVFAAQGSWHKHALAGEYVGASTEATLGVGLGANWLIGGSGKSFALQPWSVQGQAGLNYSLTWTNLTLN